MQLEKEKIESLSGNRLSSSGLSNSSLSSLSDGEKSNKKLPDD